MESNKKNQANANHPFFKTVNEDNAVAKLSVTQDNTETKSILFTSHISQLPSDSHQNGPLIQHPSTSNCCNISGSSNGSDLSAHDNSQEALSSQSRNLEENLDQINNVDLNIPSTSGLSRSNEEAIVNNVDPCKRPLSLKLKKSNNEDNDSSSDTGNEDYSLGSEDGCIYTYRGGEHLADLPSSFVSLDMGLPQDNHLPMPPNYPVRIENPPQNRERNSRPESPDMDFLEMDFDPGPSCEADGDESSPDVNLEAENHMPVEEEPVLVKEATPDIPVAIAGPSGITVPPPAVNKEIKETECECVPSTSQGHTDESQQHCHLYGRYIVHTNIKGEKLMVRRSTSYTTDMPLVNFHYSIGELGSPEFVNRKVRELEQLCQPIDDIQEASTSSAVYPSSNNAKKFIVEVPKKPKNMEDRDPANSLQTETVENSFNEQCVADNLFYEIWTDEKATEQQAKVTKLSQEVAAIVNVFDALGIPSDLDKIDASLPPRRTIPSATELPRYLFHRSIEAYTASDLISCIHKASEGRVSARFFSTYPERAVSITHWLSDWMALGAVPILTKNAQNAYSGDCRAQADSWHHQMVYGVSPNGVHVLKPKDVLEEEFIWPQLMSPPVILVNVKDIWARFNEQTDLRPLTVVPDKRYQKLNVLGQVVHAIREFLSNRFSVDRQRGEYITIPCACDAGITIVALTGSDAHQMLERASPMPLLAHSTPVGFSDTKLTGAKGREKMISLMRTKYTMR